MLLVNTTIGCVTQINILVHKNAQSFKHCHYNVQFPNHLIQYTNPNASVLTAKDCRKCNLHNKYR